MSDRRNPPARMNMKPLPAGVRRRYNDENLQKLKEDALDLMQAALNDLSPAGEPERQLTLKMGIEREGHFIPPQIKDDADFNEKRFQKAVHKFEAEQVEQGQRKALSKKDKLNEDLKQLQKELTTHVNASPLRNKMERIYVDTAGRVMMEMTTRPLKPKVAAQATCAISEKMLEKGRELGFTCHFGSLPLPFMAHADMAKEKFREAPRFGHIFADVKHMAQVFPGKDGVPLLAGRGQHGNISLWCGEQNLFAASPYVHDSPPSSLGNHAINEGTRCLPGMILPCRNGNYERIHADCTLESKTIGGSYRKDQCAAMRWTTSKAHNPKDPHTNADHDLTRIEFRQAAPDADPYDVALAAAIPVAKGFLENVITDDAGKARLFDVVQAEPQLRFRRQTASVPTTLTPTTQEEAAELFNPKDGKNPNFTFLDELAAKRIARLQARIEGGHTSAGDRHALREAEKLRNIGTKLHYGYCQQYGLQSHMPLPPAIDVKMM